MKRIRSLFLALCASLVAMSGLHAQYIIGSVVGADEAADGMEVVFEGRSDNSNKGGYLGPLVRFNEITSGYAPKLTRFEGDKVPEKIVWILCELDSVSPKTQYKLFNLKNKATGEYLASGDWNNADNNRAYRLFMVPDQADAAPFEFHYANSGDTYGGVNSGSFDSGDWVNDPSTITICEVNDAITNGRGFVANEANETIRGFYEWQDTNIWSMRRYLQLTTGRDYLNEFLNNIPYEWQDIYVVGTEPGYIKDAEKFQRFYDLWIKANDEISKMTDDECMAAYNELNELYTWLQSSESQVPLEDGGYYYFFTANTAFTNAGNGNFAIYAPKQDEPKIIGWKAFDENDPSFIWQVKNATVTEKGEVRYSVQNMGSGLYINQATSKADSQPIEWSSEFQHPTVFISLNHAGHWQISDQRDWDEYPPRPFHQENHQGGAGTAGKIVLYNGGIGTASDWFIKKVPQDKVDMLASMQNRAKLLNLWAQEGRLAAGVDTAMNALGYISSMEILNNYKKAAAEADTMLHFPQKAYTEEEYEAAYDVLKSTAEAFVANRDRAIPDGYYRIKVQQIIYKENDPDMYLNIVNGRPGWKRADHGVDLAQIWKFTHIDGTKYNVQNMGNSKFLHKGDSGNNGAYINFSDAADVAQIIAPFEAMNGQFYISNEDDSNLFYDTGDHNNGTNSSSALKYWSDRSVNGGTSWAIEPVSEEEYAQIAAGNDQVSRNYELADVLAQARHTYNQNTVYTYGNKQIIDASQIYSNNPSVNEGQHLENLIDDNFDTFWNSAWDTETVNETHYLRFETTDPAGLPDSLAFYFVERNNGTWHRVASKLRVSMSNDASEWKYLPTILEKNDITTRDLANHIGDPFYVLINGTKGYKYVRFEFLAVQPDYTFNNHPVAEYSEANLMPITGVDTEKSLTCSAKYKNISSEMFNAISKGYEELVAGIATQNTIDLLKKAVINFNNVSVADSAIAMARLNAQNLTTGDLVGDFPGDALDTYTSEVYAAIDKYEAAGDNLTGNEVTAVVNELKAAYDKLYPTMVKPEEGKWYVLQLSDQSTPNRLKNVMTAGGWFGHNPGSSYSYWLTKDSIENVAVNELTHFVFKANEDGSFVIQNVGSGFFNGPETGSGNATYDYRPIQWYEPNPVTIIPFGDGQVGLRLKSGRYFYQNPAWLNYGMTYETHDGTQGLDSKYAWRIQPSEDLTNGLVTNAQNVAQARAIAITKPYELQGLPVTDYGVLQGYKVVGKLTADNSADSIVTAYKLQALGEDEIIPAGYPVVYVAEGDKYDENVTYTATFNGIVNSEVTNLPDTVNGLAGNLDRILTPVAHMGYFLADSVVDEPAGTTIGVQRATLIPWLVKELPDARVDKIIYVKGNGMLNDIKDVVIEDQKEKVNVYSIDGVLIRRNVARAGATDGLKKGIYIVGKKKVLVK